MPNSEKGFAHILVLLILLIGLGVGLYLVTHPTVFRPKAGGGATRIEFVDDQGELISETASRDVKLKLTYAVSHPSPLQCGGIQGTQCPSGYTCVGDVFDSGGVCELTTPSVCPVTDLACPEGQHVIYSEGSCHTPNGCEADEPKVCVEIVTPARDLSTGECHDFPTPCDVPTTGWEQVQTCKNTEVPPQIIPPGEDQAVQGVSTVRNPINIFLDWIHKIIPQKGFVKGVNTASNPNVYVLDVDDSDLLDTDGNFARNMTAKLFYQKYPDNYDFIAFFFGYQPSFEVPLSAQHTYAQNKVRGICRFIQEPDSNLWGSSKLFGIHTYAYDINNYNFLSTSPNYAAKLLEEETSHQWLMDLGLHIDSPPEFIYDPDGKIVGKGVKPTFLDGINESCFDETLPIQLTSNTPHWSRGLQMPPGHVGSMREAIPWVDNGDGTYSYDRNLQPSGNFLGAPAKFHPFDLYLMGFEDKSEITGSYLLLSNIQVVSKDNSTIKADAQRVTIDDIVRIAGEPRSPDAAHSQKDFKIAFVILNKQGQQVPPALVDNITTAANNFPAQWAYATDNRSTMNKEDIVTSGSFPTQFRVANDSESNLATAEEQDFNQNSKIIPWTLSEGDGQKTVYAQFKVDGVWQEPISNSITLKETPITGEASFVLHAAPGASSSNSKWGGYKVGNGISVDVLVSSNTPANLFSAKINFDKSKLKIDSVKVDGGDFGFGNNNEFVFIKNWVEQYTDQDNGTISLVGGVPDPGFSTNSEHGAQLMAVLHFTALSSGDASVSITPDSAIYRNSDNTDILKTGNSLTLSIGGIVVETPTPTPSESPSPTSSPTPPACLFTGIPLLDNLCPTPSPTSGPAGGGDGNGDGKVDLADLSILFSDFNKTSGFRSAIDLNGDKKINTPDYSLMLNILIANHTIRASKSTGNPPSTPSPQPSTPPGNITDSDGDGDPDSTDCAPNDNRAKHGQTQYFDTQRLIVGGYDFDCNGQLDHEYQFYGNNTSGDRWSLSNCTGTNFGNARIEAQQPFTCGAGFGVHSNSHGTGGNIQSGATCFQNRNYLTSPSLDSGPVKCH